MELLLLFTGALFFGLYLQRKKQSSNYKIDQGMLMTNDSLNQVNIPLTEIVDVVRIGKNAKPNFWFNLESISGRLDNVAIFTRSNVSYLLRVRNGRAFIRELKEQKSNGYRKAEVI
ncbi:hypothetical protein AC623_10100 [Bacillus sp. FJAT-27231]|uniref:hypothetical protein n=1 Tax=Bacillus sp. FJAT-27231 TaxID=1679168 RepID=UPI000670D3CE|nr:hypothetical protein [Bacillus sp. FJAT-27231]KMY54242.1 hypothetical protein AC623_10100 [Bacillus sp. FJAT-27231]